jgi:hypothetical protein
MLVENTFKQSSFYYALYQMIPDNHILKQIKIASRYLGFKKIRKSPLML